MRKNEVNKRNYIILGLCSILMIMAIGFAAFAQQLQINGTSNITSSWNVQITGIERFASSGAGVSDASGSPSYDNTNGLTATFNTNLTSPGDYATYKIEVTNKGSLNAVLSSITGPTSNNNDITFYLNKNQNNQDITDTDRMITTNDILNPTGDANNLDVGYVYVTVLYRDYPNQQTPEVATATATVTLNFTQSNSAATVTPVTPATQTVYSWNTTAITVGTSHLTDLVSTKTTNPYYTSEADIQSALSGKTNSTFYNKYTVEGDTITEGYACQTFGVLSTAECLKMSTDGSEYGYDAGGNHTNNAGILKALQSNSTFTGASGSCYFYSNDANCYVGNLNLYASPRGNVSAYDYDAYEICYVDNDGNAYCGRLE